MQKKRDFTRRLVASLIVFMLAFTNCATLGSALVYAADENIDAVNFAAQFVMIQNSDDDQNQQEPEQPAEEPEEKQPEPEVQPEEQVEEPEVEESTEEKQEEEELPDENSEETEETSEEEQPEETEEPVEEEKPIEEPTDEPTEPETTTPVDKPVVEEPEIVENESPEPEKQVLHDGLAIEITVGVKDSGYLKNARVDIKDLASQMFTLEENISLGEYIQSIEENKIKLKQINSGTEVKIYIPIKLKNEDYVNMKKLQEGVELILTTTYVDSEGSEEILTKTVRPVLEIQNNVNLVVGSEIEKFIPYTKDGINEALVQIRVTIGTDSQNDLPIKDTSAMVTIPQIEGVEIKDVTVAAISTGFTNGLTNGEAIFTPENWNYDNAVVNIHVDNVEKDGLYRKNSGNDEYIITYKYSNIGDISNETVNSTVEVISNIFTSAGTSEISNQINKEYNLSQANQNIITYDLTRKTESLSKGYLYGNANAENPEYELLYDNTLDINISRIELVKAIEVREADEYFVDLNGNGHTANGNTYYKSVKVNRDNLISIIGENGDLELLLEDGTSLIKIDKTTEVESDGNITISFGENKIGKILIRINNPEAEGILNIVSMKAIEKTIYEKMDIMEFEGIRSDYIAVAELIEGIVTEMGAKSVYTELTSTVTSPSLTLSRKDLSTLVQNEDIEMEISLNNSTEMSDMYKNPVFELTFPREVKEVNIKDINLLYGNNELDIASVETLENFEGNLVLRIMLSGVQTKYALGESEKGTTIILKADMTVDMYTASRKSEIEMNYYNEDATNYVIGSDWNMMVEPSSYMLLGRQGKESAELNIVAPEGLVNAQMITGYKDEASIISVNQGRKEDTIATFKDARQAEMSMIIINNTNEDMKDVSILGRTIFNGNKAITEDVNLGANITAPMVSRIFAENSELPVRIYYSENENATRDLKNIENAWTEEVADLGIVKSYLIVLEGDFKTGDIMTYKYNFNIPEKLMNNIDLVATFATYYTDSQSTKVTEADRVVLTTGDAPVLTTEITSDCDEATAVPGQRIKYTVKVKNEGRSVSKETVVNSLIPEGTSYVNENGEIDRDTTELRIDLGNIAPGKTEEITYEVEVNSNTSVSTEIEPANNVEADGLEAPIYVPAEKKQVDKAELSISLRQIDENRVVDQGVELWYDVNLVNYLNSAIEDCTIKLNLPEGLEFIDAYITGFNDDMRELAVSPASYDSNNRTVIWKLDRLSRSESLKLKVKTTEISEAQKDIVTFAQIESPNLKRAYKSNEVKHILARPVIECSYDTNISNRYLKEGDRVQYILNLKNTGLAEAQNINISNELPKDLRVLSASITKNGATNSALIGKNVECKVTLGSNEEVQIVLDCTAKDLENATQEAITRNSWTISGKNLHTFTTTPVENIVQQNPARENKVVNENVKVDTTKQPSEKEYSAVVNKAVVKEDNSVGYRIIGKVFNDVNKNGQRDDNESGIESVVAKLCDVSSQEIVAQTVTNAGGEYVFDNVTVGDYYIKFEYDSSKYQVTEYKKDGVSSDRNSDAIVSNYKAITDKISITDSSVSDIDVGLYRAGIFDLSLDVNINRLTVQNEKETTTYEMENSKLAKIDIDPKYASSSKVFVEYTIEVSNKGEISGYAKSIMSYLPDELELDTSLNANWYVDANKIAHTRELENVLIQPGETKKITLLLTKQMTEDSTGLINNVFEIESSFNEYAISDIDSVEGNHADGEDDMSSADVIIGIKTGGSMINIMIITATLITLIVVLYVIKLHADNKGKEVII